MSYSSDAPAFSVVIPLFNKRAYIARAVSSVLQQQVEDFELIVIDDGSTDGSADVLSSISDPRLTVVRQANQGEGRARNAGMSRARGEWIALLDADDAWMPAHLAELAALAGEFPGSGLISTRCVETAGEGLPSPVRAANERRRTIDYFLEASRQIGVINSSSTAVRRRVYEELGGFGTAKAGADLEYWALIALRYPVALSDRVTCAYYRDTGGVMVQLGARRPATGSPPLKDLKELSPSVALLCEKATLDPALWRNPSIVAYVDSRLVAAMRAALSRGDMALARSLSGFIREPHGGQAKLYSWAARMPAGLANLGLTAFRAARRLRA